MPVYAIPLILFIGAGILNFATSRKNQIWFILIPAILSLLLLCAGQQFGLDLPNYSEYFYRLDVSSFWNFGLEPGYSLAMALVKGPGGGFLLFLFLIDVAIFISIVRLFRKYSPYPAFSWLIFYSLYMLYVVSAIRQGLALACILYSFRYIVEEKPKGFIIYVLIAFLCHSSAIFFLPAYWLACRRPVKTGTAILLIVSFLPFTGLDITPIFTTVARFFGITEKYILLYLDQNGVFSERVGLTLGVFQKILYFLMFAVGYDKTDKKQIVLYNLGLFYLLAYFPLSSVAILSSRGLDYYKIFECITMTYAVRNQKNRIVRLGFVLIIIFYSIYMTVGHFGHYDHYDSWLNDLFG